MTKITSFGDVDKQSNKVIISRNKGANGQSRLGNLRTGLFASAVKQTEEILF